MQQITGNRIADGIAIGRIRIVGNDRSVGKKNVTAVRTASQNDVPESERLRNAFAQAAVHQEELARKAAFSAGEEVAQIFRAHAVMLQDELLIGEVLEALEDRECTAEEAVRDVLGAQASRYAGMSDPFLRERGTDFKDIRNSLLEILSGAAGSFGGTDESVLLAGEEITPSDLMRSAPGSILGIITGKGGYESHTAILARGMSIPGIVCPDGLEGVSDGVYAALDATEGILYLEPDKETLSRLRARQEALRQEAENAAELFSEPYVTADGRTIRICANISGPADLDAVLRSGADGIGLFRTEMQYLGSTMAPDEEKQFESYKQVIERMSPRPVILRTFDVGSDKCPDYLHLPIEDNPALGLRGIRLSLTMRDLFKAQLRAILRASAFGPVGLLLPMVVSLREVEESKVLIAECKEELKAEGKTFGDPKLGIMIETPAAVLCAEELAPAVDFFSFGTNDLTQYICASDRQNTLTEPFADGHHPAVLKAIAMAAKAATDAGIPVGICGELASDLSLTEDFIRMGIEELSVNPGAVLPLRRKLNELKD